MPGDVPDAVAPSKPALCIIVPLLDEARDLASQLGALLAGDDAVCHSAEDGGDALVGLRTPQPALFADLRWSNTSVMSVTRARANGAGLRIRKFEALWDLDLPDPLGRLDALLASPMR